MLRIFLLRRRRPFAALHAEVGAVSSGAEPGIRLSGPSRRGARLRCARDERDARERGAPWVSVPQVPRLRQPAGGRRGRSRRATNWRAGPELDLAAACRPPPQSDRSLWRETQMSVLAKRMAEARLRTVCVRIGDLGSYAHAPKVRGPEERRHHVHHASRSKSQRLSLCAHLGVLRSPAKLVAM